MILYKIEKANKGVNMKQESGRSMIEMVGVLAIMGMLTATAFALISLGINRQKQSRVADDVVTIVSGVRGLLGDYDDFSNIDNSTIFAAMSVSDKNPYGGMYELAVNTANPRQFIVRITGLPKADCEALITKAWVDSVGYISSDRKESGATGACAEGKDNVISIIYGE